MPDQLYVGVATSEHCWADVGGYPSTCRGAARTVHRQDDSLVGGAQDALVQDPAHSLCGGALPAARNPHDPHKDAPVLRGRVSCRSHSRRQVGVNLLLALYGRQHLAQRQLCRRGM